MPISPGNSWMSFTFVDHNAAQCAYFGSSARNVRRFSSATPPAVEKVRNDVLFLAETDHVRETDGGIKFEIFYHKDPTRFLQLTSLHHSPSLTK